MKISLIMILELLELPYRKNAAGYPDQNHAICSVKLLTSSETSFLPDVLYISDPGLAVKRYASGRQFCCICVSDASSRVPEGNYPGMVIAGGILDTAELFQRVSSLFLQLNTWDFTLYNSLLNRAGLQALLDCSQEILRNHIHIVEPFARLLAYTKDIDITDADVQCFYTNFMEQSKAQPELQETLLNQADQTDRGMYIMTKSSLFAHPSIIKALTFGGSYTLYVIMICKGRPLSCGLKDLFVHLCKYIRLYGENQPFSKKLPSSQEIFINGILNRTLSKNAANIHATLSLKLPINSNFNLYKITAPEQGILHRDPIMKEISAVLPQSKLSYFCPAAASEGDLPSHNATSFEGDLPGRPAAASERDLSGRPAAVSEEQFDRNCIVVLNHYEQPMITKSHRGNIKALQPVLEKYGLVCGISNPFHTLYEMVPAFEQAGIVLDLYASKRKLTSFPFMPDYSGMPFFCFDDYMLCHFFQETGDKDRQLFLLNPYRDSIIAIKDFDTRNSTRHLETLYAYLTHERNIEAISGHLHVSREMVIHSIHSIRHLIYGDLEHWQVRLKLLLAFEYLNLHPEELG